jgi:Rha family phage regulatory protein
MDNLVKFEAKDFGVFNLKGESVVSSRDVANIFGKRHDNVLQSIADLKGQVSEDFRLLNFKESSYKNLQGKKQPEILLTRDGFTLLAMGFTGKMAMQFKIAYIQRFNEMEQFINNLEAAKLEYPELAGVIAKLHKEPKRYHFSGEADLFNMIVLNIRARDYKKVHDLKVGSIRPHLKPEEIEAIMKLQRADIGLAMVIPEYDKRKEILKDYYQQIHNDKLLPVKDISQAS